MPTLPLDEILDIQRTSLHKFILWSSDVTKTDLSPEQIERANEFKIWLENTIQGVEEALEK